MALLAQTLGWLAIGLVVAQRLVWIAPTPLGWVFYLANVVGEVAPKRLKVSRFPIEAGAAVVGLALLALGGRSLAVVGWTAAGLLALDVLVRRSERRLLDTVWVRRDRIGPKPAAVAVTRGLASGYPSPSTHPELTISLNGPFVRRSPRCSVGTLVVGRQLSVNVIVANHSLTPSQTGVRVSVSVPAGLALSGAPEILLPVVAPGEARSVPLGMQAVAASGPAAVGLTVEWGEARWYREVVVERILGECPQIVGAEISRYPGARRSAFAWRGDMDLYDTSTMQSIEGLEVTFGLAARYRMPQTMYLSTRLSLDEDEATRWSDHYGIDRGAARITEFIEWLRDNVTLRHRAEYPFVSDKRFLIELGNHGHLHYGTDTSGSAENGWNTRSRMGSGKYPWTAGATTSLEEQRDNALEARRWIERLLGFTPKSWAMPDRTRDEHTPAAMEAAGCEVLSDSDVRTRHNVLLQPRPHFAPGSEAVELTKRYPGDPLHILHYWMNVFWIHRAHRLGIPVVFMCHQHMRLYEGWACTRLTEAVLRYVVERFRGDLWINTVYGLGTYWRDILSARRSVAVSVDRGSVRVEYSGELDHVAVPVDITLEGGHRATVLLDLVPGSSVTLDARGAAV